MQSSTAPLALNRLLLYDDFLGPSLLTDLIAKRTITSALDSDSIRVENDLLCMPLWQLNIRLSQENITKVPDLLRVQMTVLL